MKLSYFGYSVTKHSDGSRYLFDIRPFLNAFCELDDVEFKSQFTRSDEHVYLLKESANLYLFLMTRTNEVIKKIKSTDLSISEIYDLLQQDEKLGFASYIYIKPSFLGFASTIMAPKYKAFTDFMVELFSAIGLSDYQFVLHPMLKQATRADALGMEFMGRASIQVNKENSLFDDLRNSFRGTVEDFVDVDSFEIIIKPRPKRDISPAMKKVLKNVPATGLDSFIMKAKETADDQLMELYLAGKGHVSDTLNKNAEQTIETQIDEKLARNDALTERVNEHEADDEFQKVEPDAFVHLHDVDSWSNALGSV